MAWTYSKISKDFIGGEFTMLVRFTDDANPSYTFDRIFHEQVPPADWPDAAARALVARLNAVDTKTIETGAPKPAPTPAPVPAPTDRDIFFSNYQKLIRLHEAVTHKVTTAIAKEVTDLEALVQSQYKPEYFTQ